jgi:excisionase family DNA binding protein
MAGTSKKPTLTQDDLARAFNAPDCSIRFPPILTVGQAAELLQVPKATIYDWSSRGRLKGCSRKIGKHLRLWRDKLVTKLFNEGTTEYAE